MKNSSHWFSWKFLFVLAFPVVICTVALAQNTSAVAEREAARRQAALPRGQEALGRAKAAMAEGNFTVAHEFAHALVRHHLPQNMILSPEEAKRGYLESNSEIAADKLVAEWGFRVPKRRSRDRKRQISNDEKT